MEISTLDPEDLDAFHDLRVRAFGPVHRAEWVRFNRPFAEAGRVLGVRDGGRPVAFARYHLFDQWWHGRAVPMGGVASVVVAPEDRGRGVGRRLTTALLELMDGLPLSALFPATAPVYRSAGYEHAGARYLISVPAEALRTLVAGPVAVRRAGPGDAARVAALLRGLHAAARDCGPIDRGEDHFRDRLADDAVYGYLADDGFLAYGWDDGGARLVVHCCVAASAETARTLWAIVGSGSSVVDTVQACVGPHDPLLWLLRDRSADDMRRESWMLRVLDAPAAIAARGFPAGLAAEVPLMIEDAHRPANAGSWTLSVAGGAGRLTRDAERPDAVRLTAGGLAALYAGIPASALRRTGLAAGGDAADPLLDAAFAATPFMLDYF